MKKGIIGSFVGVAIVIALDSFSRVVISLYTNNEMMMISYSSFDGLLWPVLLTVIAGFSVFFGAMFSLTYGRNHINTTAILFFILITGLRYGQIHLLIGYESLFYPITALILSLLGMALAIKLVRNHKIPKSTIEPDPKHHHPEENEV